MVAYHLKKYKTCWENKIGLEEQKALSSIHCYKWKKEFKSIYLLLREHIPPRTSLTTCTFPFFKQAEFSTRTIYKILHSMWRHLADCRLSDTDRLWSETLFSYCSTFGPTFGISVVCLCTSGLTVSPSGTDLSSPLGWFGHFWNLSNSFDTGIIRY